MSMRWRTFQGKRFITIDYTGMDDAAVMRQLLAYFETTANETEIRNFCNCGDLLLSKGFRDKARELRMNNRSNTKVKTALIGINKYQLANVAVYSFHTRIETRVFDAETEAIAWLVKD